MSAPERPPVVILAGGAATRMGGGDKSLREIGGRPILSHVIARLAPQAGPLAINANGDPGRWAAYGLPVLPDVLPEGVPDRPGPLAGVLAAAGWAAGQGADGVVTVAADTPFLPEDLVPHLLAATESAPIALAATREGERTVMQPTIGYWPVSLADVLATALTDGVRKITQFTRAHGHAPAIFPDPDAFFNVNTPEDLDAAREMAG